MIEKRNIIVCVVSGVSYFSIYLQISINQNKSLKKNNFMMDQKI